MSKDQRIRTTFKKGIIIPSLLFIIIVCLVSAIYPNLANLVLNQIKQFIFINLNWVYIWTVTIFVLFLVYLMISSYGKIRLGSNDSKPEYSFFSWISMLFAAGMGIGLMYFGVAEPMQHYSGEVFASNHYINRAKNAQLYTFFHWGIHAWAVYGIVGLSLSYFAYRYRLPLSLRSCFYPLLKNKINGNWGNLIDVFALCSTFFGITTTLGFGVVQINSGLQALNVVQDTSFGYQILIVTVLISLSVISAATGVDKGVKILSNINIIGVIILLLFVLFLGPTVYLIGSFTEGLGNYINNFFNLTFATHVNDEGMLPWFYNWTILYWAWWISWSPYVGLFIARISKGRTIREFIAAVLILPTLFNFIWMSVFGNSAMWFDVHIANGALSELASNADALMFRFLEYLPLHNLVSILVVSIIIIFFVTSADSGIFVMNSIATRNAADSPRWQIVFWGLLLALIALLLLNAGGLEALQTMTLITALPFSLVMLFFVFSLMKALTIDRNYYEKDISISTVPWTGRLWKNRLRQIVTFKDIDAVNEYINTTVREGLTELRNELAQNGIEASLNEFPEGGKLELEIRHDIVNNFVYGVKNQLKMVSQQLINEENLPEAKNRETYYPKSYFGDERNGYDIQYFTKDELISDILKHYERYLEIISEEKNEMFISSNSFQSTKQKRNRKT